MDRWKYYDISHNDLAILNPMSSEKIDEFVSLLDLGEGATVLDAGCGKAEPLIRIVERYGATGIGLDLSRPFVAEARERVAARMVSHSIDIYETDAAVFRGHGPDAYDLTMCLGASWIWGGYRGTLEALSFLVRPGGLVVCGEPFWKVPPAPEYLEAAKFDESQFATHAGNVAIGEDVGLTPLYALVSNDDDWDHYQAMQWRACERYARTYPQDPDVPALLAEQREARRLYLNWERACLGWAIYIFYKP